MKIYTVYDKVCEKFAPPFLHDTDASAVRAFEESLKNSPYPSDYQLYSIGLYNEMSTGNPLEQLSDKILVYEKKSLDYEKKVLTENA